MTIPTAEQGREYHFTPHDPDRYGDFLAAVRSDAALASRQAAKLRAEAERMEKRRRWLLLKVLLLECGMTHNLAGTNPDDVGNVTFTRRETPGEPMRFTVINLEDESGVHLVIFDRQDNVDFDITRIELGDEWVAHRLANELNHWRSAQLVRDPASPVMARFPDGSENIGICPLCDGSALWGGRVCPTCNGSGKS